MRRRNILKGGLAAFAAPALAGSLEKSAQFASRDRARGGFGSGISAFLGDLTYSGTTAPALVVELGLPWRFVCWADAQYVPCWDINGLWATSEWLETLGAQSLYDFEPISDKKLHYTHVEVTEIGPARAVVHWRYALCDTRERIFHGNTTAEELYTIYPDGFAVRKLVGYPGTGAPVEGQPIFWEVGEILIVHPQGSRVEDNLETEVLKITNLAGDTYRHRFTGGKLTFRSIEQVHNRPLCQVYPASRDWREFIWIAGLKNRPSPFVIIPNNQQLFPHLKCTACGDDHPTTSLWTQMILWKNWPQWKDEYEIGVGATDDDLRQRSVTTCLVSIHGWDHPTARYRSPSPPPFDPQWNPPRGTTWLMLEGVNPRDEYYVRRLAASWLRPGQVQTTTGRYLGYEPAERAYRFEAADRKVAFELSAAPSSAQINPVFVVENWQFGDPKITLDDREPARGACAVSWARNRLVVWLRREVSDPVRIRIEGWPLFEST